MKQLAKLAFIFILMAVFGSSQSQADDEYIVAYRTLQVSDGDIGIEFLEQIQSELLEYDINVRFIRWQALEERPDDALVYITFREELEEGIIVDTHIHLFNQSMRLSNLSPILQNRTGIGFFISDNSAKELTLAFLLYATGDISEARHLFLSISETDVDMNATNINRIIGNTYILDDDLETATVYLENNVWSDATSAFFGVNLVWVYLQLGRTDDAFDLISEAIKLSYSSHPSNIIYLLSVRAQLYALSLDYDSAIADIDEAITLAEENELDNETLAELYTIRGEIIFLIYEWDRVEDNFDSAIDLNPDYGRAYFQRGVLFYTMARREDALSDFQTYLELEADGVYAEEAQSYIESIEIELEALSG